MALEILGSRLLAPVFGNSLFVWGALIGVILAAMSERIYTLAGTSKRTDIIKEVAPLDAEQSLSGAGPDKFVGIDLDAILKGKNIKTLRELVAAELGRLAIG